MKRGESLGTIVSTEFRTEINKLISDILTYLENEIQDETVSEVKSGKFNINEYSLAIGIFKDKVKDLKSSQGQKELADVKIVFDYASKLFEEIFNEFNNRFENDENLRALQITTLFDRIVSKDKLTEFDFFVIRQINESKRSISSDKYILICGITISLLQAYDKRKITILIDYISDFEDNVWKFALASLIFNLYLHGSKIGQSPNLVNRIIRLFHNSIIFPVFVIVENILNKRLYSLSQNVKNNPSKAVKVIYEFIVDLFGKDSEEKIKLSELLKDVEGQFFLHLLDLKKLKGDIRKSSKQEVTIAELYLKYVDIEQFGYWLDRTIFLEDINSTSFAANPINWFVPFTKNSRNVKKIVDESTSSKIINVQKIVDALEQSYTLTDIEKYYMLINAADFIALNDDYFDKFIRYEEKLKKNYLGNGHNSNDYLILIPFFRTIYKFGIIYIENNSLKDLFEMDINIFKQNLFEKILSEANRYKKLADEYISIKSYKKAIPILEKLSNHNSEDYKIKKKIGDCYLNLNEYKNSRIYYESALFLLERCPKTLTLINEEIELVGLVCWVFYLEEDYTQTFLIADTALKKMTNYKTLYPNLYSSLKKDTFNEVDRCLNLASKASFKIGNFEESLRAILVLDQAHQLNADFFSDVFLRGLISAFKTKNYFLSIHYLQKYIEKIIGDKEEIQFQFVESEILKYNYLDKEEKITERFISYAKDIFELYSISKNIGREFINWNFILEDSVTEILKPIIMRGEGIISNQVILDKFNDLTGSKFIVVDNQKEVYAEKTNEEVLKGLFEMLFIRIVTKTDEIIRQLTDICLKNINKEVIFFELENVDKLNWMFCFQIKELLQSKGQKFNQALFRIIYTHEYNLMIISFRQNLAETLEEGKENIDWYKPARIIPIALLRAFSSLNSFQINLNDIKFQE